MKHTAVNQVQHTLECSSSSRLCGFVVKQACGTVLRIVKTLINSPMRLLDGSKLHASAKARDCKLLARATTWLTIQQRSGVSTPKIG